MSTATLSSPACRAFHFCRSLGLVGHPRAEERLQRHLIAKGWCLDAAAFAAQCVRWWCLAGQQFGPLGDEPEPDVLDVAELAEHVAEGA